VRRVLRHDLLKLIVPFLFSLIFIQGCARPVLQTYPAGEKEIETVSEAFVHYQEIRQDACGCCLDAEVDIALSVSGWFRDHRGKLSGYLQAMEPGYMRFVAINPLGQPWYILTTDGVMFKSLNVFAEKAYWGSVRSETYNTFAPAGFEPEYSYYWLIGSLKQGDMRIKAVMRDREQDAFWLQMNQADADTESMVLFDPEELLILRHVLRDKRGRHLADIVYEDYMPLYGRESKALRSMPAASPISATAEEQELCRVPGRITVSSQAGTEKIEVKLHSFIDDVHLSAEDFSQDIPDNFEQLFVR
jgi:outer membrane lipoprotein-sorting protein